MASREAFCYMWDKRTAKRGPNEVASCLYDFMSKLTSKGVTEIYLWSDIAGGQNRNRIVFYMFLLAASKQNVKICHRFMEKGHTQNEGDSVHALIERSAKGKEIYSTDEWYSLVRWAKVNGKPYNVIEVKQDMILDFKKSIAAKIWAKNVCNQKVTWNKIKEIMASPDNEGILSYKYSLSDIESQQIQCYKTRGTRQSLFEPMPQKMPNDIENYMQYRIMGYVSQVRMKPGCMPSKFECQPDRKRSNTEERPYILKKQKSNKVTEHVYEIETGSSGQQNLEELEQITEKPKMINKSIQVHLTRPFRSKAMQHNANHKEGSRISGSFISVDGTLMEGCGSRATYFCYTNCTNVPRVRMVTTFPYASRIFSKNIPILASVIRPFIVTLDIELIKKNLPMAFRHRFHKVSCISCLEIEIQKPSKAVNQALTWSDYKKANTIKYLVSSSNGLVNFISPGYGGRITDTCLVETCDFVKCLQQAMCVMADRGFKHVEVYLCQRGMVLVQSGTKFSKAEAKETKQIASLRIHIEWVIRRLREYSMLNLMLVLI
ncbi:uncharacterized protein LOC132902987 [Amyelois transitella]|uniref:uncharacterized protein LOC132902987 n=1 Tax=Amyelois transitella TaxID=680683 RepID=UPI0029903ACC|nr:uncharacterized protein LOC132902987 [Amyelois transitella]